MATPDPSRFRARALLHEGRFRSVYLLEPRDGGPRLAGHRVQVPRCDDVASRLQPVCATLSAMPPGRVPRLQETIAEGAVAWMLFDYVDGTPLPCFTSPVPPAWIACWFLQMLEALAQLHAGGLHTGGFCPTDLMVGPDGIHLVDPGYLRLAFPEETAMARSPLLRSCTAPEERLSTQHSAAGDLYSAGAVAHWLIAGQGPGTTDARARGRFTHQVLRSVEGRVGQLLELRPDLPENVATAVAQLIQFFPARRIVVPLKPLACGPPPQPPVPFLPTPLAETPVARPVAMPSEPSPPEPPRAAVWHELLDDLGWTVRTATRPILLGALLLTGLLLMRTPPRKPPRHDALHLDSGSLAVQIGHRWQRTSEVAPGEVLLADTPRPVVLTLGETRLSLQTQGTRVRVLALDDDRLSLDVLIGSIACNAGPRQLQMTARGNRISCGEDADCRLSVQDAVTVEMRHGNADVSGPHGSQRVERGRPVQL